MNQENLQFNSIQFNFIIHALYKIFTLYNYSKVGIH